MEKISYIYGLEDPITKEVRYVGKSINPDRRLKSHIHESRRKNTHKECWINGLIKKGLTPGLLILEKCIGDEWIETEKKYIKKYENLTNLTEGGTGVPGFSFSSITKENMASSRKGIYNPFFGKKHSKESIKLMSEKNKEFIKNNGSPTLGYKHKEEARAKLSEAGKRRALEGNLPNLPIMVGKDNPVAKKRILISPDGIEYVTYNLRKFCKENNISPQIILRNINKGEIKPPIDKKTLDRQRKNSKNTIGWTAIE
jgi:group I intron endonuclease